MKSSIAIVLIVLFLTMESVGQYDWEWQYSTTTEDLNDVYFVNRDSGWIVGNSGTILNTSDGGKNWYQQYSGTTNKLKAVYFINKDFGWVVGNEIMMFTEDGGLAWVKYFQGHIRDIYSIDFVDENHGWVCGSDSSILKTNNGGGTWEIILSKVGRFDDIFFINDKLGWLHSKDIAGYIYMTEDGGYTLEGLARSRKSFRSFFFLDSNLGWACGGLIGEANIVNGWVDISTDGGDTWSEQYGEGLMHSIYFFDQYHGIALGQRNRGGLPRKIYDVFLKTVDGGKNWEYCEPGGNAFYFLNPVTGWIVGNQGQIYKTTTGGGIFSLSNNKNITNTEFGLSQNYPNPFNPTTAIGYRLLAVSDVELGIYNILGQKVAVLVSEQQAAGLYQVEWDATGFSSGIYFYILKAGEFQGVKKMILLR